MKKKEKKRKMKKIFKTNFSFRNSVKMAVVWALFKNGSKFLKMSG